MSELQVYIIKSPPQSTNGLYHAAGFKKYRCGNWHVYKKGVVTLRFSSDGQEKANEFIANYTR